MCSSGNRRGKSLGSKNGFNETHGVVISSGDSFEHIEAAVCPKKSNDLTKVLINC